MAFAPALTLTPADVGRRVVIRHLLADGTATDVLGELEGWDSSLSVRRRDGEVVAVPVDAIVAAKTIEARWARDMATGELQRLAFASSPPPETAPLGDWVLRSNGGVTRRANSVLPIGSPGLPLADALAVVAAWYAERGLTPRLQVPLPLCAPLDRAVAESGWAAEEVVTVMVADIKHLDGSRGSAVALARAASAGWRAAQLVPELSVDVATDGEVVFASVLDGDAVVGAARGSLVRGWLGINALNVAPSHRRQGIATQLISALVGWAADGGGRHAYLQVVATNGPAIALYDRLGFVPHHSYTYRVAP